MEREAEIETRLRKAGIRMSEPRRAVIDALVSSEDHVSSETLALRLRSGGLRVSLSTVYRCLRLLVELGVAREIRVGDTSHYEVGVGRAQHDHLVCVRCGTIVEFVHQRLRALAGDVCGRHGYAAAPQVELRATCRACAGAA